MEPLATAQRMVAEATALEQAGRLAEAARLYQAVLAQWPFLVDTWYNLGLLLRRLGHYEPALAAYQQALDRDIQGPEEVHLNRSVIYADALLQPEAAERELAAALRLAPAYVPALLNLGNLREDLGRRHEARELYSRILAADPAHPEALARLANLADFSDPADPLIERLRQAVRAASGRAADQASLGFALGRALDACGAHEAAWEAYTKANQASRDSAAPGSQRYDRAAHEQLIDRIIANFDADFFRRVASDGTPPPQDGSPPVFICGMFRSGSTLAEQVLSAHPRVTAGGELDWLPALVHSALSPFPEALAATGPVQIRQLASRYLAARAAVFPEADVLTDKRPDNFLYLGLIKAMFPDARIVHTRRSPLDNCLSVYFLHLDHGMGYATQLPDIGHYYLQQERLMAHWRALFGAQIHEFDYDRFVAAPAAELTGLLAHCGLDWDARCLEFHQARGSVKTASVWQVRQPLYQRSSGRWRNYERQLAPLRAMLSPPR
jgi:tetratricopeptide (TPR) repeat protein